MVSKVFTIEHIPHKVLIEIFLEFNYKAQSLKFFIISLKKYSGFLENKDFLLEAQACEKNDSFQIDIPMIVSPPFLYLSLFMHSLPLKICNHLEI